MCKFHKDVAVAVATHPESGKFDPVVYSITLCALAKFWVDKYMPDMGYLDGYSYYEMATPVAKEQFSASGLETYLQEQGEGAPERISFLRRVTERIIIGRGLTLESLNLPKHPDSSPRFLDKVMLDIYEGDPQNTLSLKAEAGQPLYEPMRQVLEAIYRIPNYEQAIEGSLKASIATLFIQAPENVSPAWLDLYRRFPVGLRTSFASCSLHSGGGVVAHAVLCGGLNTAIGGLSTTVMNSAMYAVAPVVAVGTTIAVEKYRLNDFNPYKLIVPVVLSLSAAFAVSKFLPHQHSDDPKMVQFYGLNVEQRHTELQRQYQRYLNLSPELRHSVEKEAKNQEMTISMFMVSLNICGGDLTPRIQAYERLNQSSFHQRELN
jgi:hypothetical protein